jgi:hypothetical protein
MIFFIYNSQFFKGDGVIDGSGGRRFNGGRLIWVNGGKDDRSWFIDHSS